MLAACWAAGTSRNRGLFACAACRRAWGHITQPACRKAVEVEELFADGRRTFAQLERADEAANALDHNPGLRGADLAALWCCAVDDDQLDDMGSFVVDALRCVEGGEPTAQADLLRCIFGNPFRPLT